MLSLLAFCKGKNENRSSVTCLRSHQSSDRAGFDLIRLTPGCLLLSGRLGLAPRRWQLKFHEAVQLTQALAGAMERGDSEGSVKEDAADPMPGCHLEI